MAIEIEIAKHKSVKAAVCHVIGDDLLKKRLVAYIVPEEEYKLDASELREYMRTRLTPYMIPNYLMKIDKIPINEASGKTNYKQVNILPLRFVLISCFKASKSQRPS